MNRYEQSVWQTIDKRKGKTNSRSIMDERKSKQLLQKQKSKAREQKRKNDKTAKDMLLTALIMATPEQKTQHRKKVVVTETAAAATNAPTTEIPSEFESFFSNSIYAGVFGTPSIPA